MNNIEAYLAWAPDDAKWSVWAKPALFYKPVNYNFDNLEFAVSSVKWFNYQLNSMVIVDLPGEKSVTTAIALAQLGLRPVPLYNGTKGPAGNIVDVENLTRALYWGAEQLSRISISKDANPVFLLDSRRMKSQKRPGAYDNRWCVFPQDMPSSDYLLRNNIQNVIVNTDKIQDDLAHILCRYQEKGIRIYQANETGINPVQVHKPSMYKSMRYRLSVILGLTRNSAGGFGGVVN